MLRLLPQQLLILIFFWFKLSLARHLFQHKCLRRESPLPNFRPLLLPADFLSNSLANLERELPRECLGVIAFFPSPKLKRGWPWQFLGLVKNSHPEGRRCFASGGSFYYSSWCEAVSCKAPLRMWWFCRQNLHWQTSALPYTYRFKRSQIPQVLSPCPQLFEKRIASKVDRICPYREYPTKKSKIFRIVPPFAAAAASSPHAFLIP